LFRDYVGKIVLLGNIKFGCIFDTDSILSVIFDSCAQGYPFQDYWKPIFLALTILQQDTTLTVKFMVFIFKYDPKIKEICEKIFPRKKKTHMVVVSFDSEF